MCVFSLCIDMTNFWNVRTLEGLYEIDPLFVDVKTENLQVCYVHCNKDNLRHHQLPRNCTTLVEQTCLTCCQNVKAWKLLPCIQHTLCALNNWMLTNSAKACCFFSEYCTDRTTIIANEDLYHTSKHLSQISSYICVNCKERFLQLAKSKKLVWRETQKGQ